MPTTCAILIQALHTGTAALYSHSCTGLLMYLCETRYIDCYGVCTELWHNVFIVGYTIGQGRTGRGGEWMEAGRRGITLHTVNKGLVKARQSNLGSVSSPGHHKPSFGVAFTVPTYNNIPALPFICPVCVIVVVCLASVSL